MANEEPIGIGRLIARNDERVARGEMIKVWRGLTFSYKTTEKGDEVDRKKLEPLRLKSLQKVRDLAEKDPPAAAKLRFIHLHTGLFRLAEQPDIPGFPLETAESLANPPALEKPESKRAKHRGERAARLAAQIIVGR